MSKTEALKNAKSLSDVARLIGVEPKVLSFVLYKMPDSKKYTSFCVPKRSGGVRTILAPNIRLKRIQRSLADFLSDVREELESKREVKRPCVVSHGFRRGFSIITNARRHRNRRFVFNADVRDFFPSVNFGRVYGFFVKNNEFLLDPAAATVIAQIACHNNQLPQGSPCSPIISDLIGHILDMRLSRLAARSRCTYTRYADDLTFSTNERVFPDRIARLDGEGGQTWVAGDALAKHVFRSGFRLNPNKTRVQYRTSRQDVTGLVVNKKISVPTEFYHTTRAMCHHLFNDGVAFVVKGGIRLPISDNVLRGRLSYIHYVRKMQSEMGEACSLEKTAPFKLYKRFLNFASFFGNSMPLIVGEGVTDTIYLKAAINQMAAAHPMLVEMEDGKKKQKVHFFKYSDTSRELMGLSGGTGELKNLLGEYRSRIGGFKFGGLHPVIILVDNDSGAEKLFQALGSILKKKVDGKEPFYYVYANLYVVPVPDGGSAVKSIEGLFPSALLATLYKGKSLDLTNKETDGLKYYSKHTFAKEIVRLRQDKIDFSGFGILLKALEDVISDYGKRLAAGAVSL